MQKNKLLTAAPAVQSATPANAVPLSPKEQLIGRLMDTQEILQVLNLSRSTLYNYRIKGLLTPQNPSKGKVYYDAAQVQKLLLPDDVPTQQKEIPATTKKKKP